MGDQVLLLVIGFALTSVLGGALGYFFQTRSWAHQHRAQRRDQQHEQAMKVFQEVSSALDKRLYRIAPGPGATGEVGVREVGGTHTRKATSARGDQGRSTTLVPTATSNTSRSATSMDATDDPDVHGRIDSDCRSAGAERSPVQIRPPRLARSPLPKRAFGIFGVPGTRRRERRGTSFSTKRAPHRSALSFADVLGPLFRLTSV